MTTRTIIKTTAILYNTNDNALRDTRLTLL